MVLFWKLHLHSASKKTEKTPTGRIRELRKGLLEMGSLERRHSEKVGAPPPHPLSQLVLRLAGGSALSFRELPRGYANLLCSRVQRREARKCQRSHEPGLVHS